MKTRDEIIGILGGVADKMKAPGIEANREYFEFRSERPYVHIAVRCRGGYAPVYISCAEDGNLRRSCAYPFSTYNPPKLYPVANAAELRGYLKAYRKQVGERHVAKVAAEKVRDEAIAAKTAKITARIATIAKAKRWEYRLECGSTRVMVAVRLDDRNEVRVAVPLKSPELALRWLLLLVKAARELHASRAAVQVRVIPPERRFGPKIEWLGSAKKGGKR